MSLGIDERTSPGPARGSTSLVREPPIWHLAATSLLRPDRRLVASRVLARLPMVAVLVVQAALTLRLSNTAFQDEALYINGGHAMLAHWLHGSPTDDLGAYFSGAPAAYPVIAALLDDVGGLWLVRLFSLACMLSCTFFVRSITTRLYGARAGLLAAAGFAVTGPVLFLGGFATFDAACLAFLAAALWLAVCCRRTVAVAVAIGAALSIAAVLKYAGGAFAPVVLGVAAVTAAGRIGIRQAGVAAASMALFLGLGWWAWGSSIRAGVAFTTTSRHALFPTGQWQLWGYVGQDVGILAVLALLGLWTQRHSVRGVLQALGLLAGAALLPASQLRLGEAVSFEKHLTYSALFLAPLAGRGLYLLSLRRLRTLGVALIVFVMWINGLSRSLAMYQVWPDVSKVITLVQEHSPAGKYLSTSSDALQYYLHAEMPQAAWETQYGLFGAGDNRIRQAVDNGEYQYFIFRSGTSGNAVEDGHVAALRKALDASPRYELVTAPFPTRRYAVEDWYVYRLTE